MGTEDEITSGVLQTCCCSSNISDRQLVELLHEMCWLGTPGARGSIGGPPHRSRAACCQELSLPCSQVVFADPTGTKEYWDRRYAEGMSSSSVDDVYVDSVAGLPVSYHVRTKLLVLILEELLGPVNSVLDLGVGDGTQAALLLMFAVQINDFVGVDISPSIVEQVGEAFAKEPRLAARQLKMAFHSYDGFSLPAAISQRQFDLVLSLEVLMHVVEDDLYHAYLMLLFGSSRSYVIIQSPNTHSNLLSRHMRLREFTDWVAHHARDWERIGQIPVKWPPADNYDDDPKLWIFAQKGALLRVPRDERLRLHSCNLFPIQTQAGY